MPARSERIFVVTGTRRRWTGPGRKAMRSIRASSMILPLAITLLAASIGFGASPQKDKKIEVKSTIKDVRPPAGALPQEANDSSYLDLLKKGYAYLGAISYSDRRRGAKPAAVRDGALIEAQKAGAQVVRLDVGESSDTVMTPAYRRTFTDGHTTTTFSSDGGMKFKDYLYAYAEVFVADRELASQQLQVLEKRLADQRGYRAALQEKVGAIEKGLKEYASAHPDDKDNLISAFVGGMRAVLEAPEPDWERLASQMERALDHAMLFLDREEGKGFRVNYLRSGDRGPYLEALCSASSYFDAVREALTVSLNSPSDVLSEKR